MVPSLSTLAAPWRAASRLSPSSSNQTFARSSERSDIFSTLKSTTSTVRWTYTLSAGHYSAKMAKQSTRSILNEAFDIVASHPRYRPHAEALKKDYTVQNIISQGKHSPIDISSSDVDLFSVTRLRLSEQSNITAVCGSDWSKNIRNFLLRPSTTSRELLPPAWPSSVDFHESARTKCPGPHGTDRQ